MNDRSYDTESLNLGAPKDPASSRTPLFAADKHPAMSYRGVDSRFLHRPLVDFIPDDNLHVDDEDEAFYAKDEDFIIHPKWKALAHRSTSRIPRRVQRYCVIYFTLLIFALIGWKVYFGPKYYERKEELRLMDALPKSVYGSNVRPEFKDMIHVKTLDEKHLPVGNKRLVVVGDVHGCKEELEQLLNKVDFNHETDHLILTGDMIAKGPDSTGVVSLTQKLGASCVRGNHEDKLLLSIAETRMHHVPLPGPDEDPDRSSDFLDEESHSHGDYKLRKLAKQFNNKQIEWLKQCPVILRVGQIPNLGQLVVVHGGLVPDVPLEKQDPFQCMNMRTIDLATRMPSAERGGTEWAKFWNHRQKKLPASERTTVIYGHDAKRGKNIQEYSKGLDSNCVRGGHLTAMIIDAEGKTKLAQVKCKGYVQ